MDEKKTYDYKGTVTISTEEYRDLIERNADLKNENRKESDRWLKEYQRANELEKQLGEIKADYENLKRWKDSKEELKLAFKLFLVEEKEGKDA